MFEKLINPIFRNSQSVFLSHNSIDKFYGNVLRKLMISSGISNSSLIYTSHEKNKIPVGENIYNYLSTRIEKSNIVMFLLSEEYFKSVVCLNEMGASWVSKNTYYVFFVPGFDKNSQQFLDCCINQNAMGIILNGDKNCRQGLLEFIKDISKQMKFELDLEILYDEVEKSCTDFRNLTPANSTYVASILDIRQFKEYKFCKLDILIPTGERYHEQESHWLQLNYSFIPIAEKLNVGSRVKFKVKDITSFEQEKYGNYNFRNIYIYQDSINLL